MLSLSPVIHQVIVVYGLLHVTECEPDREDKRRAKSRKIQVVIVSCGSDAKTSLHTNPRR